MAKNPFLPAPALKRVNPTREEMGDKKYFQKIDAANKQYDNYKAGKRDPVTGEYYHEISFNNPNKKSKFGQELGQIECKNCAYYLTIRTSTSYIICPRCNLGHSLKYNRDTKTLEINAKVKDSNGSSEQLEQSSDNADTTSNIARDSNKTE